MYVLYMYRQASSFFYSSPPHRTGRGFEVELSIFWGEIWDCDIIRHPQRPGKLIDQLQLEKLTPNFQRTSTSVPAGDAAASRTGCDSLSPCPEAKSLPVCILFFVVPRMFVL